MNYLQNKLKQMERENPSENKYKQGIKKTLSDLYELKSQVVEAIPQKEHLYSKKATELSIVISNAYDDLKNNNWQSAYKNAEEVNKLSHELGHDDYEYTLDVFDIMCNNISTAVNSKGMKMPKHKTKSYEDFKKNFLSNSPDFANPEEFLQRIFSGFNDSIMEIPSQDISQNAKPIYEAILPKIMHSIDESLNERDGFQALSYLEKADEISHLVMKPIEKKPIYEKVMITEFSNILEEIFDNEREGKSQDNLPDLKKKFVETYEIMMREGLSNVVRNDRIFRDEISYVRHKYFPEVVIVELPRL